MIRFYLKQFQSTELKTKVITSDSREGQNPAKKKIETQSKCMWRRKVWKNVTSESQLVLVSFDWKKKDILGGGGGGRRK